jgi:hypothetical protein
MLGVSIDEVWQQDSLLPHQQDVGPKKSSKYTIPMEASQKQRLMEYFHQEQGQQNPQNYQPTQAPNSSYSSYSSYPQYIGDVPPPISGPATAPSFYSNPNSNPYGSETQAPIFYGPPSIPQMIPQQTIPAYASPSPPSSRSSSPALDVFKEKLSQQSSNVSDCQREVAYLKTLVQQLKGELQDSKQIINTQNKKEKKQHNLQFILMISMFVVLIVILVLVIQLSQKLNKLLNQPLMSS